MNNTRPAMWRSMQAVLLLDSCYYLQQQEPQEIAPTYNLKPQHREAKTGGPWVWGQPGCTMRLSRKTDKALSPRLPLGVGNTHQELYNGGYSPVFTFISPTTHYQHVQLLITFKHWFLPVYKSIHFICVWFETLLILQAKLHFRASSYSFPLRRPGLASRQCLRSFNFHLQSPPIADIWF